MQYNIKERWYYKTVKTLVNNLELNIENMIVKLQIQIDFAVFRAIIC